VTHEVGRAGVAECVVQDERMGGALERAERLDDEPCAIERREVEGAVVPGWVVVGGRAIREVSNLADRYPDPLRSPRLPGAAGWARSLSPFL
jgi:hypothetical protein